MPDCLQEANQGCMAVVFQALSVKQSRIATDFAWP
jgi:hypothetical protein